MYENLYLAMFQRLSRSRALSLSLASLASSPKGGAKFFARPFAAALASLYGRGGGKAAGESLDLVYHSAILIGN